MSVARASVLLLLCLSLLAARVLGLHVHHAHAHPTAAAGAGHQHDGAHRNRHVVMAGYEDGHAAEHLALGDVDVDTPDKTTGKPPVGWFVAILSLVALLLPLQPRAAFTWPVRRRLLRPPRWTHFKPLSHAPPRAA